MTDGCIYSFRSNFFLRSATAARCWGDPHLITLDSKQYTFNGWGEYVLASAGDGGHSRVAIQARMQPVTGSSATIVTAYAMGYFDRNDGRWLLKLEN